MGKRGVLALMAAAGIVSGAALAHGGWGPGAGGTWCDGTGPGYAAAAEGHPMGPGMMMGRGPGWRGQGPQGVQGLGLSDEQRTQVAALSEEFRKQMDATHAEHRRKLEAILTPAQLGQLRPYGRR